MCRLENRILNDLHQIQQVSFEMLTPLEAQFSIGEPSTPNIPIWRYMDFAKFMWMMENSALYLPSISQFNDAHEGVFTKRDYAALMKQLGQEYGPEQIRNLAHWIRKNSTTTCWHINEVESSVMWDAYSGQSAGLAIRSTSGRLHKSMQVPDGIETTYGAIRYLNYEEGGTRLLSWTVPALYKRTLFQSESEFRVIFKEVDKKPFEESKILNQVGVDLQVLIEGIYVSPNAETWFTELVREILAKRNLDQVKVINSAAKEKARWMETGECGDIIEFK